MKEQGICAAESAIPIHTTDSRKEVALSFFPEEHEFAEDEPVTVSYGFSQVALAVLSLSAMSDCLF